jgi:uncharacterized protein (DUF58 family)
MTRPSDAPPSPLPTEVLDAVSSLTIEVRRVVQGFLGGSHSSLHQSSSVEFAEHKKYNPGDDIRHIDWRAFARTDKHFVKTREREVILSSLVLLDCSASMGYAGSRAGSSKLDYARVLAGALAHILVRQGDAAGLLPFGAKALPHVPPIGRPEYLPALFSRLAQVSAGSGGKTGYAEALHSAADQLRNRALIILISDLWGADREVEIALASLSSRGHDVAILRLLSPDEVDLPFDRTTEFVDLEDGARVEVDPALIREDYRRALADDRERWRRVAGQADIDLMHAVTSAPPESVLAEFAARRHRAGRRR